jgi:hypothetical protein
VDIKREEEEAAIFALAKVDYKPNGLKHMVYLQSTATSIDNSSTRKYIFIISIC